MKLKSDIQNIWYYLKISIIRENSIIVVQRFQEYMFVGIILLQTEIIKIK